MKSRVVNLFLSIGLYANLLKQIIHYLEITKETQSNTLTIDRISNVRKWKLQLMETKQFSFRFKQGVTVNK